MQSLIVFWAACEHLHTGPLDILRGRSRRAAEAAKAGAAPGAIQADRRRVRLLASMDQ